MFRLQTLGAAESNSSNTQMFFKRPVRRGGTEKNAAGRNQGDFCKVAFHVVLILLFKKKNRIKEHSHIKQKRIERYKALEISEKSKHSHVLHKILFLTCNS